MSPVPQSSRGKQQKVRVPLTAGIKKFLRERPVIVLPELNNNNVNKQNVEVKKPLQNGQKVVLPMSKMKIVNGLLPPIPDDQPKNKKKPDDPESNKLSFLSALNLTDKAAKTSSPDELSSFESTLGKKLRSRKGQVTTYFRNNPVPISSTLGKRIILVAGLGKCVNPTDEVAKLDKYCSPLTKIRNTSSTSTQWPEINTRRSKIKKGQYVHTYAYGHRQRLKRKVELTIGLRERCYPLYNQCRDVQVVVHRMTDADIARELTLLAESNQRDSLVSSSWKKCQNLVPKFHWISSLPLPGPSRGVEVIRRPVVELFDIRYSPNKAKYFR